MSASCSSLAHMHNHACTTFGGGASTCPFTKCMVTRHLRFVCCPEVSYVGGRNVLNTCYSWLEAGSL